MSHVERNNDKVIVAMNRHKLQSFINWLWEAKTCLRAYADSEGQISLRTRAADHGLRCSQTESLDTTECVNGEQRLG